MTAMSCTVTGRARTDSPLSATQTAPAASCSYSSTAQPPPAAPPATPARTETRAPSPSACPPEPNSLSMLEMPTFSTENSFSLATGTGASRSIRSIRVRTYHARIDRKDGSAGKEEPRALARRNARKRRAMAGWLRNRDPGRGFIVHLGMVAGGTHERKSMI